VEREAPEKEVLNWWLVCAGVKTRGGRGRGPGADDGDVSAELSEGTTRTGLFQSNPNHVLDGTGRISSSGQDRITGPPVLGASLPWKTW
jgi:hypothetical protein